MDRVKIQILFILQTSLFIYFFVNNTVPYVTVRIEFRKDGANDTNRNPRIRSGGFRHFASA